MPAPAVRDLNSTIADLTKAYDPQFQQFNQQEQQVQANGEAATAGLNAAKDTAFRGITASAQDRGALFSGFKPEEQARYTADTYLPALAKMQQTIAEQRGAIQQQRAGLTTGLYDKSLGLVENDKQALSAWQNSQDQINNANTEADKQRAFTAQQALAKQAFDATQSQLDRNAQASLAAKNAAAAKANAPTIDQALIQLFSKYDPANKDYYTERVVLPTLAKSYGYDISKPEQKKALEDIVYGYRGQFFGEGRGTGL